MVLVQMYVYQTTQTVDLNLPAGRYKVKLVGACTTYTGADTLNFALSFRSQFTMMKYGNVRYLQLQMPHNHWSQINGDLQWEADYFGAFQLDVIDMSTGVAPVGARFFEGTYFFDVEPWAPTNLQHVV
jgi:hypothetical protein